MISPRGEIRVWFANNDTKFAELSGNVKAIDQKLASLDDLVKNQDGKRYDYSGRCFHTVNQNPGFPKLSIMITSEAADQILGFC